ncbi:hypothetical protein FB464_0867 [Subtercola boreus]|nr:hypothetical protein FB464_0867 [Subtercola boreus]
MLADGAAGAALEGASAGAGEAGAAGDGIAVRDDWLVGGTMAPERPGLAGVRGAVEPGAAEVGVLEAGVPGVDGAVDEGAVAGADGAAGAGALGAAGPGRPPPGRTAVAVDVVDDPPLDAVVAPPADALALSACSASFRRRATGGSMLDEGPLTNWPISLSFAMATLLSTPSSLAISCTRGFATILLVRAVTPNRDGLSCVRYSF